MTRRHAILFLWVLGILLPMAWLTQFSPGLTRAFNRLFGSLWAHVLMHALLFAILGYLTARLLQTRLAPARWMPLLGALLAVLAIAALQEGIQLLYKARPPVADDVFDLVVDTVAGGLGAAIAKWRGRA